MSYKFSYKRVFFWRSVSVVGHKWTPEQDKMVLYFKDGSIEEIAKWSTCSIKLGVDWVLAVKKSMEAKAGQPIPLNVGA